MSKIVKKSVVLRCFTDRRKRVGKVGTKSHPTCGAAVPKCGQERLCEFEQDIGSTRIHRRVETGKLSCACEPQAGCHRRRRKTPTGKKYRSPQLYAGRRQHEVISALRFERHDISEGLQRRLRPGTRCNYGNVSTH